MMSKLVYCYDDDDDDDDGGDNDDNDEEEEKEDIFIKEELKYEGDNNKLTTVMLKCYCKANIVVSYYQL